MRGVEPHPVEVDIDMLSSRIVDKLAVLYGGAAVELGAQVERLLRKYGELGRPVRSGLDEGDVFLITYGDSVRQGSKAGLAVLAEFVGETLQGLVTIVHILPCFPSSSDDGFSVIDYRRIDPVLGDWSDVERLAGQVELCFDFVLNHCSKESEAFRSFLDGDECYDDFFIEGDPEADYSAVLRPRTLPLLNRYSGAAGEKYCWTTFSEDQVDLNFKCPGVLLEMLDVLLFYVSRGAGILRLDAIAYLWKELGTSCAHLPQTHLVVQLFRDVLDLVYPGTLILTETNVPHQENISYFGDGHNEAHMVYNFPLGPLVLHTLTAENAEALTGWAKTIEPVSETATFLNFTASHDGIGVRPVAELLSEAELGKLINLATEHGGDVSYKNDAEGKPVAYELNINYFDALNNPHARLSDVDREVDRFVLSQAIALSLMGLPAIYIHSLLGSRNWNEGVEQTGRARVINREKLDLDQLREELANPQTIRAKVFGRLRQLIEIRREKKAFHPQARQEVLSLGAEFFAVRRTAGDESESIVAVFNVTGRGVKVVLDCSGQVVDLVEGKRYNPGSNGKVSLDLLGYQFVWLK